MTPSPYILWDWNGTLLDDSLACVSALNAMLSRRGIAAIDLAYYRRFFSFPARDFYERLGMRLELEDWDAVAKEYHDAYLSEPAALAKDALDALELVRRAGVGQSIVSALRQDHLDAATARHGVSRFFDVVRGTDNLDGASKTDVARELAAELSKPSGRAFVMIGDSLHDKEVADAIGAKCVLFSGGSHSAERLEPAAPTAATLADAARIALDLV